MNDDTRHQNALALAADIVSAFVSNNTMAKDELPQFIQHVYKTLLNIDGVQMPLSADRPQPAVPLKKSVMPDYIICLEDGKKLKMLKRHLRTTYNMSPEEYRERWGLPVDYPMVAPNYAKQRSRLAKDIGLGTQGRRRRRAG